jgi:hypothetical protein
MRASLEEKNRTSRPSEERKNGEAKAFISVAWAKTMTKRTEKKTTQKFSSYLRMFSKTAIL